MSADNRTAEDVFKDMILHLLGLGALFATLAENVDGPGPECGSHVSLAMLGKSVANRLADVAELASDGKFVEARL